MRALIPAAAVAAVALALALPAAAQEASAAPAAGAEAAAPASAPADQADAPADQASSAPAAATDASASLAVGTPVKDKTGVTIGTISELKADAAGKQVATVKMGADTFAVDTSSFALQDGAALLNATQAELQAMVKKASGQGG